MMKLKIIILKVLFTCPYLRKIELYSWKIMPKVKFYLPTITGPMTELNLRTIYLKGSIPLNILNYKMFKSAKYNVPHILINLKRIYLFQMFVPS